MIYGYRIERITENQVDVVYTRDTYDDVRMEIPYSGPRITEDRVRRMIVREAPLNLWARIDRKREGSHDTLQYLVNTVTLYDTDNPLPPEV